MRAPVISENKCYAIPGHIYINWSKIFGVFLPITYRADCAWVFVAFFRLCRLIFRLTCEQYSGLQFLYGEVLCVVLAPLHLAVRYVYLFHWLLFAIQTMAVKSLMDSKPKSIFLPFSCAFNVQYEKRRQPAF